MVPAPPARPTAQPPTVGPRLPRQPPGGVVYAAVVRSAAARALSSGSPAAAFALPHASLLDVTKLRPSSDISHARLSARSTGSRLRVNVEISFPGQSIEQIVDIGLLQIGVKLSVPPDDAVQIVASSGAIPKQAEEQEYLVHGTRFLHRPC